MTITQFLFDALVWCRYFAVNQTIGRPEVKLLFYEAFQDVYNQAILSHPEYFEISLTWAGASIALPDYFRHLKVIVVNDAGCTAGYARVVDNTQWDTRQANSRNAGSVTDPLARIDSTTVTIAPSMTGGRYFFLRNFAESAFTDETQDMALFLPLIYHPLLLARLEELIMVRHFKQPENPTETEKHLMLMRQTMKQTKRAMKPLEIIEGLTEKPSSIVRSQ